MDKPIYICIYTYIQIRNITWIRDTPVIYLAHLEQLRKISEFNEGLVRMIREISPDNSLIDPIHKAQFLLSEPARLVFNTKHVQRLTKIKQISPCEYLYPSIDHSRLTHSLGYFEY